MNRISAIVENWEQGAVFGFLRTDSGERVFAHGSEWRRPRVMGEELTLFRPDRSVFDSPPIGARISFEPAAPREGSRHRRAERWIAEEAYEEAVLQAGRTKADRLAQEETEKLRRVAGTISTSPVSFSSAVEKHSAEILSIPSPDASPRRHHDSNHDDTAVRARKSKKWDSGVGTVSPETAVALGWK